MTIPALDPRIAQVFLEGAVHEYRYHPEIAPFLCQLAEKIAGPGALLLYDHGIWFLQVDEKTYIDATSEKTRLSVYTQDSYLQLAQHIGKHAQQVHKKMQFACTMLKKIFEYISDYKTHNPSATKDDISQKVSSVFKLERRGSLFHGTNFHIRFSQLKGSTSSFNNTVLSLSSLQPYDHEPCAVCIVRDDRVESRLINSTFLKCISHSSKNLTNDHVRGTFLGSDIQTEYNGISNAVSNASALMRNHYLQSWSDNLSRLVDATKRIEGTKTLYQPSAQDYKYISTSPLIARKWFNSPEWSNIERTLQAKVTAVQQELLALASNNNVNIRGNRIETLITGSIADHRLDDLTFPLDSKYRLIVDVKSKILDRNSNPKGVNIDKLLESLSTGNEVHAYFFVIIDPHTNTITSRLVPMLETHVMKHAVVQNHWSGRNSRGTTQMQGSDIVAWTSSNFDLGIDPRIVRTILQQWVKLGNTLGSTPSKPGSTASII